MLSGGGTADDPDAQGYIGAFLQGLQQLGWTDGRNVRIDTRWAKPWATCSSASTSSHALEDGRICLSNNAAERELRGIALGRKSWLFAGSDRGGERAAVMLTLIQTAKLNDIDPQAWLADVLARIADHKITELAALLPWNWRHAMPVARAA